MTDDRINDALRRLQPDMAPDATDSALGSVHRRSLRRRRQRQALAGLASIVLLSLAAGAAAMVGTGGDSNDQAVLTDSPATTTATTTSTTAVETTTTVPTETTAPEITEPTDHEPARSGWGTFDDLAVGVTGLGLHTWMDGADPLWEPLWRADPALASEVAAAIADAEIPAAIANSTAAPLPDHVDFAAFRFELADGRLVVGYLDLESGWVGQMEPGSYEPGGVLPDDLARRLRSGFNDAVSSPWQETDLGPSSRLAMVLGDAGAPWATADAAAANIATALENHRDEYEQWYVETYVTDRGPVVEVRERGIGDDSVRGSDYRLRLVQTDGGWTVGGAESRWLCLRGVPSGPDYLCV
jgi:hypothetical protein